MRLSAELPMPLALKVHAVNSASNACTSVRPTASYAALTSAAYGQCRMNVQMAPLALFMRARAGLSQAGNHGYWKESCGMGNTLSARNERSMDAPRNMCVANIHIRFTRNSSCTSTSTRSSRSYVAHLRTRRATASIAAFHLGSLESAGTRRAKNCRTFTAWSPARMKLARAAYWSPLYANTGTSCASVALSMPSTYTRDAVRSLSITTGTPTLVAYTAPPASQRLLRPPLPMPGLARNPTNPNRSPR
mmetsp:Transcript_24914/g.61393  ORF Transcript_24914/g.61393 Transcript_24914/m.61393 type:complete len:248 (-) Transcript_24914:1325-2068(-)